MLGRTVSHYRIEEELGKGGMGVVYRARDLSLNRNVAIKFLWSEIAGEEQRRRFQQEAQTASALNHPNILTVHEAGVAEGQQYLVTEFVDGGTLRDWLARAQPSLRQKIALIAGIADALATAHHAGILHRDIKPENILVSKTGHAKLADFGLAKLLEAAHPGETTITAGGTRPGAIIGTLAYMSPEQAQGFSLDGRSDIFSFGILLYELFGGMRPFEGKSDLLLLQSIIHAEPRPLADAAPNLPYELRLIVEKALEKDPADRYQSMREMVVDLKRAERLKDSKESAAFPSGAPAPVRRPWIWAAVAGLGAIALAAAAWLWPPVTRAPENPLADARITRLTDFEGSEKDAAISADGKLVAFISDRDGPFHAWITQIGSGAFLNLTKGHEGGHQSIDDMASVGFNADATQVWMRVFVTAPSGEAVSSVWMVPTLGGDRRLFLEKGVHAAWSPDGKQLAYHETTPGDPIFVADPNGANRRQIYVDKPGVHCHNQVWSPDGRFLYFTRGFPPSEMDIWRIPSAGGAPERITHHNSRVGYPTVLDSRTLLYIATAEDSSNQCIYSMDLQSRIARRITLGVEQYTTLAGATALSEPRLVATVANPTGALWTIPISQRITGEPAATRLSLSGARAAGPRYGPGYVAYLSSNGGPSGLWKFAAGNAKELWKGSDGGLASAPAVSSDGKQICFTIRKQERTRLYLMTAEGTDARPLAPSLDVRDAPAWSPDGKWIAIAADEGQGSRLFKAPVDGGQPVRLVDSLSRWPVWSPDGRCIVYSASIRGAGYTVRSITPDGKPFPLPDLWVLRGGERYHFLPDGKGLIVVLGELERQNFWLIELPSGHRRQLTDLSTGTPIRSFDISPDGREILFDRVRDNSDIVLIDLPRRK